MKVTYLLNVKFKYVIIIKKVKVDVKAFLKFILEQKKKYYAFKKIEDII